MFRTTDSWVVYPKPNQRASLRLFCFPYAGRGASIFYDWSESLPMTVEVCSLQFPGRESRIKEAPFTQFTPLVQAITQVLLPHLDRQFAFFGHSMGALVCFEVARQLRKQYDVSPVHLFVSGSGAPQTHKPSSLIHNLPELEFIEELCRLNGIPKEVMEYTELMQLMLPILRADLAVYGSYVYSNEPPFDFPISVFGGLQDKITRDRLEAWRDQTIASFSLQMFPGDHFFLHTTQVLLLQNISQKLSQQ
ncbi:putative thioesterase [Scytonema sp. UIC 10036]|uniref:thioesterase II family protein n=1 Tax=Scytonema sp. UIC 10036 TaxID=2304196 RepID=UPI0012DACA97|nr:thioesterase domain-containing protein [Scytonema sp. UIC 10036]MUG92222.1 putative thioesterase [Scytonema sp. UIC 10036]